MEWRENTIATARSHGDERPGDVILREASQRGSVIREAFTDSRRDKETCETVSLREHSLFNRSGEEILLILKGEVLTVSNRWSSPSLDPNRPY